MGSGGTAVKAEFKTNRRADGGRERRPPPRRRGRSDVYRVLKAARVAHMAYVPDAGHATLIELIDADPEHRSTC